MAVSAPPPLILGDTRLDRIIEAVVPFMDIRKFFPALTPETLAEHDSWLMPHYLDPATGNIVLCFQSYVLRTPRHTILIDSCIGNHKNLPMRPQFDRQDSDRFGAGLAALGLGVADIDFVMCTHLHFDHVGWNTRLVDGRWVPTFPNARYVFSARELDFWTKRAAEQPETCPWIADSVAPIVEAKRHVCVSSDHAFEDEIRLIPTPGHTIDHFSVEIGGNVPDAIVGGDMVHSPLQILDPGLGMMSDWDSGVAGETRRRVFGRIAGTPTRLCTAHFAADPIIRITETVDGFGFEPAL